MKFKSRKSVFIVMISCITLFTSSLTGWSQVGDFTNTVSWPQMGSNNVPGSISVTGSGPKAEYQIRGNGNDIWNTQDEGFFAYQTTGQNNSVVMQGTFRWDSTGNTLFSRVGLMMRENPDDPSSRFYHLATYGGSNRFIQAYYRNDTGGNATLDGCTQIDIDDSINEVELRLIYNASTETVTGQYSLNKGQSWNDTCSHRFSPAFNSSTVGYGAAITSYSDDNHEAVATIKNFSIFSTVSWPQIGNNNIPGSISISSEDPTAFTILGNGNDIWNNQDEGFFVFLPTINSSGNVTIQGKVKWNNRNNPPFARAGFMVREKPNDPSSRYYHVATYGGSDSLVQGYYRNDHGGASSSDGCTASYFDNSIDEVLLRLIYDSSSLTYTGSYSLDNGTTWTQLCSHRFSTPLDPATTSFGFAITSFTDDTNSSSVTLSDLSVTSNSIFTDSVSWPQIGSNNVPGSVIVKGDGDNVEYQLLGNGNDIWNAQDEGFYIYKQETGNVTMEARVVWNDPGHQGTDKWPKIGLMAREDPRAPNSPMFYVDFLGGGDRYVGTIWRDGTNVSASGHGIDIDDGIWEVRLRLHRDVLTSTFSGEYSLDKGATWNSAGSYTFTNGFRSLTASYGLAITSFDENHVAVGTINELSITSNKNYGSGSPGGGGSIISNGNVTLNQILAGNANARYENLTITGIPNGNSIVLQGLIDITNNEFAGVYSGSIELLGLKFDIKKFTIASNAINVDVEARLPNFLGGIGQRALLELTSSGIALKGGRFEIPAFQLARLDVDNAFIEIIPPENLYGGGGDFGLIGLGKDSAKRIGGAFKVQNDQLVDLTINAANLGIPMGATGMRLDTIFLKGTDLNNLDQVKYNGTIKLTGGPDYEIAGRTVNTFAGEMGITYQPANGHTSLDGLAKIFNVETANAGVTYQPPNVFEVRTGLNFFGIYDSKTTMNINQGKVTGSLNGTLKLPASINIGPLKPDMTFAQIEANIIDDGRGFRGKASLKTRDAKNAVYREAGCEPGSDCGVRCITLPVVGDVCSPHFCGCYNIAGHRVCIDPVCWGRQLIAAAQSAEWFSFTFEYRNGNIGFSKTQSHFPAWETPYNKIYSLENGASIQFMSNWKSADKVGNHSTLRPFQLTPSQQPITTLNVPEGAPTVIFRITFQNMGVTSLDASLTKPDQTILQLHDGFLPVGYETESGFSGLDADEREAYFLLFDPIPGDYQVALNDVSGLGDYSVELLIEDEEPYVDLIEVFATETAGVFEVDWIGSDEENEDLDIKLYLDSDREGLDGVEIPHPELFQFDDDGEVFSIFEIDTNFEHIQPGWYYVYMTTDDGSNPIQYDYSNAPIFVDNTLHPNPLENIIVSSLDEGFTVTWDADDSTISNYTVVYTTQNNLGRFENTVAVGIDVTQYTINGLQNGVPVFVSVVGNDELGRQSGAKVVQRVIPTTGPGQTPAYISSEPELNAVANYDYMYIPKIYDGDIEIIDSSQQTTDSGEIDRDDPSVESVVDLYHWELLEGPTGMTVNSGNGLMVWRPTEDQAGTHRVALALFDNSSSDNPVPFVQEFEIQVHSVNDNYFDETPFRFISIPPSIAIRNTTYEYQLFLFAADGFDVVYDLVGRQPDMEIDEHGLITWDVPEDAISGFVSVDAILISADDGYIIPQTFFLNVVDEQDLSTSVGKDWLLHSN